MGDLIRVCVHLSLFAITFASDGSGVTTAAKVFTTAGENLEDISSTRTNRSRVADKWTTKMPTVTVGRGVNPENVTDTDGYGPGAVTYDGCTIRSSDPYLYQVILDLRKRKSNLIKYNVTFANSTDNPLLVNATWSYEANRWSRVATSHGKTLLSLAFNYGVMSLKTLSLGVVTQSIVMQDSPHGCFLLLQEDDKIRMLLQVLVRDFSSSDVTTLGDDESICHEVIHNDHGYAQFKDRCCHQERFTRQIECTTDIGNIWLTTLYVLLSAIRVSMVLFGPSMFVGLASRLAKESVPYVVKLKEPLMKTIFLCKADTPVSVSYRHKLNLKQAQGFAKLKKSCADLPVGQVLETEIHRYDIMVRYSRLLPENKVPVGLLQCLCRAIFMCKVERVGPFINCCKLNMLRSNHTHREVEWINFWKKVGGVLLFLTIPIPLYFRVFVYYEFEYEEILHRRTSVESMGLIQGFSGSLIHYMGPFHPLFVLIYVLYVTGAILLVITMATTKMKRQRLVLLNSLRDLERISWLKPLDMLVSNFIWPFQRFGVMGSLVALLYWPIALPVSVALWVCYCLPVTYFPYRIMYWAAKRPAVTKGIQGRYVVKRTTDETIDYLKMERYVEDELLTEIKVEADGASERLLNSENNSDGEDEVDADDEVHEVDGARRLSRRSSFKKWLDKNEPLDLAKELLGGVLCVVILLGLLLAVSECIGFLVEMLVFTLMGIIVNAGSMLKYVSLLFLVIIYSYDCYNNVAKKYLKLNKALFGEIKGRIKDLAEVTSLPSDLQENTGFKSVENSEQADYESPDDLSKSQQNHWNINDLILFIDNEDMPRIPSQLFDEVCQIRVAGSPGPVYASLLEATSDFFKIVMFLFFVFLVVLSFGAVYQVNSTNQTLATLAGGFLPLIMRSFMTPTRPDIEFGTVSFKSKLDEIIQNFCQSWPIFDFPFQLKPKEPDEGEHNDPNLTGATADLVSVPDEGEEAKEVAENNNNNLPESDPEPQRTFVVIPDEEPEKEYDVDIVIFLPQDRSDEWLDEWSDIEQYGGEDKDELELQATPYPEAQSNNIDSLL